MTKKTLPVPIRLQKLLADHNYGSRRRVEEFISAGRITINNHVAQLGDRATILDKIKVDGKLIKLSEAAQTRVLIYNKPEGEICSNFEPFHENTVFDRLPRLKQGRWVSIGRLDINTSGLLLFTNDGDFAHSMMHPNFNWERIYIARVRGMLTVDQEKELLSGVMIDGRMAQCGKIKLIRDKGVNNWYEISLYEGRNREVKRLFEYFGIAVSRLKRVQYGPLLLPITLKQGEFIDLSPQQIEGLIPKETKESDEF